MAFWCTNRVMLASLKELSLNATSDAYWILRQCLLRLSITIPDVCATSNVCAQVTER